MRELGGFWRVFHALPQDDKLVAAETGQHVTGQKAALEPPGYLYKRLVTDRVAEAVVDYLEAVDVDEEHRRAGAGLAVGIGRVQAMDEEGAVRQARERVAEGERLDLPV